MKYEMKLAIACEVPTWQSVANIATIDVNEDVHAGSSILNALYAKNLT